MITEEEARVFREFCRLSSRVASDYKELDPPDYVRKDGALAVELCLNPFIFCDLGYMP